MRSLHLSDDATARLGLIITAAQGLALNEALNDGRRNTRLQPAALGAIGKRRG